MEKISLGEAARVGRIVVLHPQPKGIERGQASQGVALRLAGGPHVQGRGKGVLGGAIKKNKSQINKKRNI